MSQARKFIKAYPNVDIETIRMQWNGRRGHSFDDKNQFYRERIIKEVMASNEEVSGDLMKVLFEEEAAWASKSLTYRFYLPWLSDRLFEDSDNLPFLVDVYTRYEYALMSLLDTELDGAYITKIIGSLKRVSLQPEKNKLIEGLEHVLKHREENAAKVAAFEAYVAERDKIHVAASKNFRTFWKESSIEILGLIFVVPLAILLGVYLFGVSILVGLLPMAIALVSIFLIYKVVAFIVR